MVHVFAIWFCGLCLPWWVTRALRSARWSCLGARARSAVRPLRTPFRRKLPKVKGRAMHLCVLVLGRALSSVVRMCVALRAYAPLWAVRASAVGRGGWRGAGRVAKVWLHH